MAINLTLLIQLLSLSTLSFIHASGTGFTADLIHHDSPNSPFYNPQETHFDRLRHAFFRSIARKNYFKAAISGVSVGEIHSRMIPNEGDYLISVSLGTPPVEILATADTGGDVLWTQCKPCKKCYKQNAPLFDPGESSTYRDLSCNSEPCEYLRQPNLREAECTRQGLCRYRLHYGDNSYSKGNLATETLTIGSSTNTSVTFPETVFGCGQDDEGTFGENASGIIGLGGGPLSLINQLDSQINGKFSYCLLPFNSNSSSKLNFGSEGVVSGEGVVSTPLVDKKPNTFYYLTLEGISVGDNRISPSPSPSKANNAFGSSYGEGNIIIDSGTTLTLLPSEIYKEFESSIKESINIKPLENPQQLCYQINENFQPPLVTVHFTNADVVLKPENTFVPGRKGVACLAFIPSDEIAIFGNVAQVGFLVGYDTRNRTVSFKPTDCTKF